MADTEAQGIHGTGTTRYTAVERNFVIACVIAGTIHNTPVTVADIAEATGLRGNTIRKIMSDADGVDLLLGGTGNGYIVSSIVEGGAQLTQRLESQVAAMQARIDRRKLYAATMGAKARVPKT